MGTVCLRGAPIFGSTGNLGLAQIGHINATGVFTNSLTGDISITTQRSLVMDGGLASDTSNARIGHGGALLGGGSITVPSSNIEVLAGRSIVIRTASLTSNVGDAIIETAATAVGTGLVTLVVDPPETLTKIGEACVPSPTMISTPVVDSVLSTIPGPLEAVESESILAST